MKRQAVPFSLLLSRLLPLARLSPAERARVERALAQGSAAEQEAVALETLERLSDLGALTRLPDRLEGGDRIVRWQKNDAHEVIALRFDGPPLPAGLVAHPRMLLTLRAHAPADQVRRLRRLDDALLRADGRPTSGDSERIALLLAAAREVLECDSAAFFPRDGAGDYTPPTGEAPVLAPWIDDAVVARDRVLTADDAAALAGAHDAAVKAGARAVAAIRVLVAHDGPGDPGGVANGTGPATFAGVLEVRCSRPGAFPPARLSLLSMLAENFAARARQAAQLERLVFVDGLTGAFNSAYFRQALDNEVARARREGASLALVIADIDDFKKFNTQFGYEGGNAVLAQVAKALRRTVRPFDSVARWGGEEFAVLLTSPVAREDAETIAERLRHAVEEAETAITGLDGAEHRVKITVSLGAALIPDDAADAATLWRRANQALLEAKLPPKNRVVFWKGE